MDAGTKDDAHEEVGNDAGDGHHQALDDGDASVECEDEEEIMKEPRMKIHHEVTDGAGDEGNQDQVRHGRDGVADDEGRDAVMPV